MTSFASDSFDSSSVWSDDEFFESALNSLGITDNEEASEISFTEPPLTPRDLAVMKKFYLGVCSTSQAEAHVGVCEFRVYMQLQLDDEISEVPDLMVVHKHYNGVISHYRIVQFDLNGDKRFYVDCEGPMERHFPTVLSLIKYYKENYILSTDFCDVFPKLHTEDFNFTSSSDSDFAYI